MKRITVLIVFMLCLLNATLVFAAPETIPDELFQPSANEDISINNFGNGLTTIGASWQSANGTARYITTGSNFGCYQLQATTVYALFHSKTAFTVKGNRNYQVSFLYNTDFINGDDEVNVGLAFYTNDGQELTYKVTGLDGQSKGWKRFAETFTVPAVDCKARFTIHLYGRDDKDLVSECYLSDLHITELPAVELTPLEPGEGMVFGGSSESSGMAVKGVATSSAEQTVTVNTSGARYVFDKVNNTVSGIQTVGKERKVVTASLNKRLANLSVISRSLEEVILSTGEKGVTFGIQMDGMMLVSTHGNDDLVITTKSEIAGKWNRLYLGQLISRDEVGGFTVNSAIPFGTGTMPRYIPSEDVDFEGIFRDTSFISSAEKGWEVTWNISSGEMLAVSVFPPKEYDWKFSFNDTIYRNYTYDSATTSYVTLEKEKDMKSAVLFNFSARAWGMSYSDRYEISYEDAFKDHIAAAKAAGVKPTEYMSFYFWHNRDVDEYIKEVQRHKDEYGIEGVYSDGLPDMEWLASYDCVRRLRELFPDGTIIIHTTGQSLNGGPPLACPDIYIPAVDTYGSMTLRGEDTNIFGIHSPYPQYVASGFGGSNTPGFIKGNRWYTDESFSGNISEADADLINLVYNGRARLGGNSNFASAGYMDILNELKADYQSYRGDIDDYYRYSYGPLARKLVREELSQNDATPVFSSDFSEDTLAASWMIYKEPNTDVKITDKRMELSDLDVGLCSAELKFEEQNGILNVSYELESSSELAAITELKSIEGEVVLSLMQYNGKLYYMGSSGGYQQVKELQSCNNIDISVDVSGGKFTLSVNGTECLTDVALQYDEKSVASICLMTHRNTKGRFYIDNLNLTAQI